MQQTKLFSATVGFLLQGLKIDFQFLQNQLIAVTKCKDEENNLTGTI